MVARRFLVYIIEKHMVAAKHSLIYIAKKPLLAI